MKKGPVFPLPITLFCTVFLLWSLPFTQSDDLIEEICKQTPFHDLCVSSLEPSNTADVKGLACTMANLVLSNATDMLGYIEEQIKAAPDPKTERALADCAELYIPVVKYNLPQAIDALNRGKFGFAQYAIADASKQAEACGKYLSGANESTLYDRNNLVKSLCDVAVSIVSILLNL